MTNPYWQKLGIAPCRDEKTVKRAYAKQLKVYHPEHDPEGYQALRAAFDWAITYCRQQPEAKVEAINWNSSAHVVIPVVVEKLTEADDVAPQNECSSDEQARKMAENAMEYLLSDKTDAQQRFEEIMHSDELKNLKVRHYFDQLCLNQLVEWCTAVNFPYQLASMMEKEFRWLQLQTNNPYRAHQVSCLEIKLQLCERYYQLITVPCSSRRHPYYSAAKCLTSKFQPRAFKFSRFCETDSSKLRELIKYFKPWVAQGYCPQLDTQTFHWWAEHLDQTKLRFIHIIVGFILATMTTPLIHNSEPWLFATLWFMLMLIYTLLLSYRNVIVAEFKPFFTRQRERLYQLPHWQLGVLSCFALSSIIAANIPSPYEYWLYGLALIFLALAFGLGSPFMLLLAAFEFGVMVSGMEIPKEATVKAYAVLAGGCGVSAWLYSISKIVRRFERLHGNSWFLFGSFAVVTITLFWLVLSLLRIILE